MQYSTLQYSTVQFSTVHYSTLSIALRCRYFLFKESAVTKEIGLKKEILEFTITA